MEIVYYGSNECPKCSSTMIHISTKLGKVLCMKCGYWLRLDAALETSFLKEIEVDLDAD